LMIFASDSNVHAIEMARKGIYSADSMQNVSDRQIKEYFDCKGQDFQVSRTVRKLCVFAVHDLLKDPPFSNIDIICSENATIRMGEKARTKVMEAFHYALKPSGYLIPGTLETITGKGPLFVLRVSVRDVYTKKKKYISWLPAQTSRNQPAPGNNGMEVKSVMEADKILLSEYVSASILVDGTMQVIRFYGTTFPYLQPVPGKATLNLFKLVRDEIVFELQTLITQVKKTGKPRIKEDLLVPDSSMTRRIILEVRPIQTGSNEDWLLIIFRELGVTPSIPENPLNNLSEEERSMNRNRQLARELRDAKQQILLMSEAFEQAKRDLQALQEELMSNNEELKSMNDQLEASREELETAYEALMARNVTGPVYDP
jgi:two-component system CheB/CheR fusion protein